MDLSEALDNIRTGNIDSYKEIILLYQPGIIRYLYRMTGDHDIALDLAQDTFIRAYRGILKTDTIDNFKAWIYKIATNNALQYLRRKKLVSFISLEALKTAEPPGNDRAADDAAEELVIKEILGKIPGQQRTCLVLHYVEGFKYREIAETIGISEEAVRKRIARGKETFRQLYNGGESR